MKKTLLIFAFGVWFLGHFKGQILPSYVPSNSLIAWWPFNGNAQDMSGNGNNGTLNGPTQTVDRNGNANAAYNFNAANLTKITFTNQIIPQNQSFSLSFWVKTTGTGGYQEFFSQNFWPGAFYVGLNGQAIRCGDYWQSTGVISIPNVWEHFVVVRDFGINVKIYKNGVLVATKPTDLTMGGSPTDPLVIGKSYSTNLFHYTGGFDDFGIWNRTLSQQEVNILYLNCPQINITSQPLSQTVTISNNAQFFAACSSTAASYNWQINNGQGFQNLSNAGQFNGVSTATLTVSNVSQPNNNQQFRCIIADNCSSDTTNAATLNVTCPQFSITNHPTNQSAALASNVQFTVSSSSGASSFKWQSNVGFGFQNISNAGQYSGANSATLTVSNISQFNNNEQFRCIISNQCKSDTSQVAALSVLNSTAVKNISNKMVLKISPNPSKGYFSVSFNNEIYFGRTCQILNVNGQIIDEKNIQTNTIEYDASKFASGVYLIKIEGLQESYRLLIE